MNELLAKLTNLSYEFFSVILPGFIAGIFLLLWWIALGPIAPLWSFGFFPHLTADNTSMIIKSLSLKTGIGVAVPSLTIAYFFGHILHWIARSGRKPKESEEMGRCAWWRKICCSTLFRSLLFRIPKPLKTYDDRLQPLYDAVQAKFAVDNTKILWEQFFPVLKSYLAKNLSSSLVATYQSKYTLHRSITAAASGLFWVSIAGLVGGCISNYLTGIAPRWGILVTLSLFALLLVWGFSSSYQYYWQLFGNTIITESYATICGPTHAKIKE
jgi:hypothetical protein